MQNTMYVTFYMCHAATELKISIFFQFVADESDYENFKLETARSDQNPSWLKTNITKEQGKNATVFRRLLRLFCALS